MKGLPLINAASASYLAMVVAAAGAPASPLPLRSVADIPLSGNTTRLDYESLDTGRHLLFIAHLGDSAVIAFDTKAQRVVARIEGVSKVHGVLAVPEVGKVYASATGTNEVVAIDETSFKITARMPGGVYQSRGDLRHDSGVNTGHGSAAAVNQSVHSWMSPSAFNFGHATSAYLDGSGVPAHARSY